MTRHILQVNLAGRVALTSLIQRPLAGRSLRRHSTRMGQASQRQVEKVVQGQKMMEGEPLQLQERSSSKLACNITCFWGMPESALLACRRGCAHLQDPWDDEAPELGPFLDAGRAAHASQGGIRWLPGPPPPWLRDL